MRCPCCGAEHAEEKLDGVPFTLVVCPSLTEDNWLMVQAPRATQPPTQQFRDLMVVPTALAAKAREMAQPPIPDWMADWSTFFR
jgi:hypothetical protein